jgi:flagellin
MSGIVLSASVRQNLLSLQATANLLATTQNDLATGKKVNSALDNPTNFFTAQSLDNRASDIGNLLDGIGNGVQVLQAANTGITSLQSLIDSAKSIANQALQTTVGYSTKSNVSTTIAGATAANLLGTTTFTSATASGNVLYTGAAGGTTAATSAKTLGGTSGVFTGAATNDNTATPVAITAGTKIYGASAALTTLANTKFADGDVFTINGKTVTVKSAATPSAATLASGTTGVSGNVVTDGGGNSTVYLNANTTVGDFLKAFDLASGVQVASNSSGTATVSTASGQTVSTINGSGAILLQSTTGQDLTLTGKADDLAALGLTSSTGGGNATVQAFRTSSATSLNTFIQAGSSLNVDGHVITFKDAATPATAAVASGSGVSGNVVTDGSGNSTVYLQSATLADVLNAIDLATGVQTASNSGGAATLSTATGQTNSSVNASGQLKL